MIDLNDVPHPFPPQVRYDLDAIVARLRATAETWVPRLFPNGRRVGDEWRLANIKGAAPRKQGSCVIALKGEHAGDWHDFDGSQGGGPLSAIEEATGLKGRDLFAYAAEMAGWSPGAPIASGAASDSRRSRNATPRARSPSFSSTPAPLAGTPASAYLRRPRACRARRRRSAGAPGPDALGDEVRLPRADRRGARSRRRDHRPSSDLPAGRCSASRTGGKGGGLEAAHDAGQGGGRRGAAGARSATAASSALCEGIETGLAVMTACPGLPVWATLSTSGLEQVQLPAQAHAHRHPRRPRCIRRRPARRRNRRAPAAGRRPRGRDRAAAPPGDDFNDLLLREGPEAVRSHRSRQRCRTTTAKQPHAEPIGQHRPHQLSSHRLRRFR